jgi:hypothetical protein
MGIASAVQAATSWWAVYYSDHQMVSAFVGYLHLVGLMVGGGTALAIDRQVLASARRGDTGRRATALAALRGSHTVVIPALALVVATGALMTVADLSTFLGSQLFWTKMVLVGLLFANGAGLVAAERAYVVSEQVTVWRRLVAVSGASFCLWLITLWMGVWLAVAA